MELGLGLACKVMGLSIGLVPVFGWDQKIGYLFALIFITLVLSQDKTRQDKTRQDKTRQDKTRQDKTRQDKTRQILVYPLIRCQRLGLCIS